MALDILIEFGIFTLLPFFVLNFIVAFLILFLTKTFRAAFSVLISLVLAILVPLFVAFIFSNFFVQLESLLFQVMFLPINIGIVAATAFVLWLIKKRESADKNH